VNELDDAMKPQLVDAALLDAAADAIRRYVVLSDAQRDALALWCAHCHAFEAADATPYPHVTSAERESGKTRLAEVLALLTPRALHLSNTTTAALARSVSQEPPPVLLLDESDNTFKREREYVAALLAILNDGYRRGGQTLLCLPPKCEPSLLPVFSPKAVLGLGQLPDTVASRSIRIELKRKTKDEHVERFRRREALAVLVPLRDALAAWADEHVDTLAAARPELPDELGDRAQDVWESLLAVADLCGADWPQRARTAALELSSSQNLDEESLRVRALFDIRSVLEARKLERISSTALAEALNADEEAPWGDLYGKPLTTRALAKMLKPFGVRPRSVRFDDNTTAKGYHREQFNDAFGRYLDSLSPETSVTPSQPSVDAGSSRNTYPSQADTHPSHVTDVVTDVLAQPGHCDGVTDKTGYREGTGHLTDENGRCKRHPDEPKPWCVECRAAIATPSQDELDARPVGWATNSGRVGG